MTRRRGEDDGGYGTSLLARFEDRGLILGSDHFDGAHLAALGVVAVALLWLVRVIRRRAM
jgi:hypothetical protein